MAVLTIDQLIQHLEETFPDKFPQSIKDIADFRILQGEQRVIAYIKSLMETQNDEVHI